MKILLKKEPAGKGNLKAALAREYLPLVIEFDHEEIIGLTEVKRLMTLYKEMLFTARTEEARRAIKGHLDFRLFNKIRNFDLTFIAALNLIKFSFKNINIQLTFEQVPNKSKEEECLFRFGHFLRASFLAYGHEIFRIVRDGKPYLPGYFLKTLSGYLPFIYVEEGIFKRLFHEPFKNTWDKWWRKLELEAFENLKDKKNKADKIYLELRKDVIQKIDLNESTGDPEQNLLNFYIIYLFNAVRKFHFIKKILKDKAEKAKIKEAGIKVESVSSLGIGLSRNGDQEYEKEIQKVFDKILDKPPAFIMLFSYFIEKFYNPKPPKRANDAEKIKTRVEFISNIFYFTNEILYGIRELAKNIIEHSSNGRGVIIGRVLNRDDLSDLKEGIDVDDYLKERKEEEFIDLIVLDDGHQGIIEKTIDNLNILKEKFKENPDILGKFETDIGNLSSDRIALPDFFNPGTIKLNYQEIRSALSLGLLIFSHLVLENNGYMMVSSPHKKETQSLVLFEHWQKKRELKEIVPLGTFYNIIFPKSLTQPPTPRSETVPFEMPSGGSAFKKLFKLIRNCKGIEKISALPVEQLDHEERLCFIDYRLESELRKDDIGEILDIFKRCESCPLKKIRKILSIDLKKVYKFDPTDLFRFLAKIQMVKDIKSIIVHNVKDEIVFRLIELFKIFRKVGFKIGSNDHFVLFHYLTEEEREINYYYSFLLAGESWDDLFWINQKIAKTNYTQEILQKQENNNELHEPSSRFHKDYCLNPLFTSEGHLLPFDVLIRRSGLTLFERNVLSDLKKTANHKSSRSYKFVDAHMRLGSKIHLKDFFYARRIFQNSFYSLRFAYLISQYIESNIHEWLKSNKNQTGQFTVVGYGLYSELLISNVTRFLKGMNTEWEINHALVSEVETFKVQGKVTQNVILIIPISSTLSTSLKIEMRLKRVYPQSKIIGHPINVMIVGNKNLKDIIDDKGTVVDDIVNNFWNHLDINKKIIIPKSKSLKKKEKFFLYLPSKWYLPQNCELCFPTNPAEEWVLFETDKVSVTPSLIFELPPSKEFTPMSENIHFGELKPKKSEQKAAVLPNKMLRYGHTTRGNNHYLYYVETTDFLKRNEDFLKKWLLKIKDELKKKPEVFESKVILIAPAHLTNADFINLVNEIIFNDVATLLHYDQNEDYIQNLKSFFGEDITKDSYVFFIDDAVSSGRTYEKINEFVKYARSGKPPRGVDGAFVLLNRLTQDKYSILVKEMEDVGFFAFIDLDVPIMINSERFCHLCSEKKRYEKMLSETLLDSIRVLIQARIIKLEETEYKGKDKFESDEYKTLQWKYIKREKCIFSNPNNQKNYLKRLEFVHKLYRGFSNREVKIRLEEIFKNCKSLEDLCREIGISHSGSRLIEDEKVNFIKVLSYPYFVYHKEIRKYIFRVVIMELEKTIRMLLEIPDDRNLKKEDMDTYRYLKFLIKRAAMLKSNYLLRYEVLTKIIALNEMLRDKLQKKKKREEDAPILMLSSGDKRKFIENLDGFIDYYIMCVKEVIWYNESKSLKLEESINRLQLEHENPSTAFSLLTNSLRVENISILYQFVDSLEKEIVDIELTFAEKEYLDNIQRLSDAVIKYCLDNPYLSSPFLAFLDFEHSEESSVLIDGIKEEFLKGSKTFNTKVLPMILLKSFFLKNLMEKEIRKEKGHIKSKMDYILFCLCKILDIDPETGGAFFVVKYLEPEEELLESRFFSVGHIGINETFYSFEWKNSMTLKMFDEGETRRFKTYPLTYVQVIRNNDIYYTHLGENLDSTEISETKYFSDMKSFLFLRIADADLDSTARGVFVFYSNQENPVASENLRYAMILKNDIYDFLKKNYENDTFRLWIEDKKIDDFYAHIIHRVMKNIVNPVLSKKILAPDNEDDTEFKKNIEMISKRLTSYSSILTRYKKFEIYPVDFSILFSSLVEILRGTFPKIIECNYDKIPSYKIKLNVPVPLNYKGDPEDTFKELLYIVMENILDNSFDPSKGNSESVIIDSYIQGKKLIIKIIDFGRGIENKNEKIYEAGFSEKGLGLGFRIIRSTITELLNGEFIPLSIEDGIKGLTIEIRLPIYEELK